MIQKLNFKSYFMIIILEFNLLPLSQDFVINK